MYAYSVPAPEGFDGHVFYEDGSRSWKVSIRRTGDQWWKTIYLFGHAHLHKDAVIERATTALRRYVETGSAYTQGEVGNASRSARAGVEKGLNHGTL